MNRIVHNLILDMKSTIVQQTIDIQRYDTGRKLVITLSDNGSIYSINDGCYAVFTATKPDGNILYNHCEIVENTIVFDLLKNPQVAAAEGEVRCEIRLYGADGSLITSPCFDIVVDKTLYTDNIIESSSEFSALTQAIVANINATEAANKAVEKAQEDVAEAVNDAETKVNKAVSDANTAVNNVTGQMAQNMQNIITGQIEKVNNAVADMVTIVDDSANAFLGNVRGAVVSMSDVSSIEHTAKVKAKSKNLIALPYHSPSQTTSGVTFTINEDGSVTVNGTAEAKVIFYFQSYNTKLKLTKGESYVLSGCPGTGSSSTYMIQGTDGTYYYTDDGRGKQFVAKGEDFYFYIVVYEGFTANNLVFKPQLELGEVATEFTPWVDVSAVNVTRCGKNLIPYPFPEKTLTRHGITYTDNGDGSITANGTATENSHFIFEGKTYLPVGKYALSGCPSGGSASTYYMTVNGFSGIKSDVGKGGEIEVKEDSPQTNYVIIVMAGVTVSNLVFKPQLELGTVVTEYEPYKGKDVFAPNADGSVDGMKSFAPNMTLYTDAEGVEIVCEYNRNSNIVLQELYNHINSAPVARIVNVALPANKWSGSGNLYSQVVTIEGITERSQVDLTPSVEQLSVFYNKDLAFVTENEDGIVTVYSIGQKPTNDYTIQATVTEVNV